MQTLFFRKMVCNQIKKKSLKRSLSLLSKKYMSLFIKISLTENVLSKIINHKYNRRLLSIDV